MGLKSVSQYVPNLLKHTKYTCIKIFENTSVPRMYGYGYYSHIPTANANVYSQHSHRLRPEIAAVCCQGVLGGQSVSVISVYVTSQSWEWHESHKRSLRKSCAQEKAHHSVKLGSEFVLVFFQNPPK